MDVQVGTLGSNVDFLDKNTIEEVDIACYYEAQKIKELYDEKSALVPYNGEEPIRPK